MGGCCSVGDSSEDSVYRLAAGGKGGSRGRSRGDKQYPGAGTGGTAAAQQNAQQGSPTGGGTDSSGTAGAGGTTSGYSHQRASFVYPKMPSLPKRTPIESPSCIRKQHECSESKINALFEKYRDKSGGEVMLMEGIVKFCGDLGVSPEDFSVLVLAWHFGATQMGRFTREEFVAGCRKLNADSAKQVAARLPELVRVLDNPQVFKDFYRWSYQFALDSEVGQRILSLDMAVQLWPLVFANRSPAVLPRWVKFLQKSSGGPPGGNPGGGGGGSGGAAPLHSARGISRDTWNMFLHFVDTVGDRFDLYSAEEAWPSLIDDFVEHENTGEHWRSAAAAAQSATASRTGDEDATALEDVE